MLNDQVRQGAASVTVAKPGDRAAMLPFLGWVGFSLLVFYAIVIGGGWIGIYSTPVRVLNLVIITIALAAWLIVAWRRPAWRPTTSIWPAFVVPLAALVLSAATSSLPRLGFEYVAWAVLLTALYLLLVRILALPYARARIGGLMAILALVLGLAYVTWSVILWVEWWGLLGELRPPPFRPALLGMTWGSPSVVLTVQVLMVAAAAGGLGFSTRPARITVGSLVTLTAVAAVISGSRSGWLALAGAIATTVVLAIGTSPRVRTSLLRALRGSAGRTVLAAAAIGLVVGAIVFGPPIVNRFFEYGDGGRPTYWATALRMSADAPLLGQGPGTWMVRRPAYTEAGELDLYQPHAHGQLVQTAAELGLVGLAAGAVAFACVGWLLLRAFRGTDPMRRRFAWASLFGLLYLAFQTVVDVHTIPTVAILVAIPIAVLDATSDRGLALPRVPGGLARPLRAAVMAGLVIGCVAAIAYLARAESTALTFSRAVAAVDEADWDAASEPVLAAADADPEIAPYHLTSGLVAAARGDWETAETAFGRAADIDDLPQAWLGLAAARHENGRPADEVVAALEHAIRLGEQQPALAFAVGQAYDRMGMTVAADDAYARTLAVDPTLAADPRWRSDLGSGRFESIVDAAIESDPGVGWEIALMAGDPARARALAAEHESELLLSIIDAWEGDPAAMEAVRAAVDASPVDSFVLGWAARLSHRAGDAEEAARYSRLVRLGPHYGISNVLAAVGERSPEHDGAFGTSTFYYGTYSYRRTTPVDLLLPTLEGLVVADAG